MSVSPIVSKHRLVVLSVSAGLIAASAGVFAQTAPKAPTEEEMLKQLTTPRKTRSLGVAPVSPAIAPSATVTPVTSPVASPAPTVSAPTVSAPTAAASPAPASIPVPPPAPVTVITPSPEPVAITIAPPEPRPSIDLDIRFDFNSASIRPESKEPLERLARVLKNPALASAKFAIEGHTDAKGRADYNQRLSEQRADAVKSLLVKQGIATDRLSASGKGSSDPANPQDAFAAENRRVRVVNLN